MTNIAFALPEQLSSFSLCSVGKTLKIVKCTVRSEPKTGDRINDGFL